MSNNTFPHLFFVSKEEFLPATKSFGKVLLRVIFTRVFMLLHVCTCAYRKVINLHIKVLTDKLHILHDVTHERRWPPARDQCVMCVEGVQFRRRLIFMPTERTHVIYRAEKIHL